MVFACNLLRASANAREYEEQVRIGDKMGALQNVFSPNLSWRTMISSFFSAFDQFRTMTPIDVVDILVVAYIIYRVMKLLKDTSAARLAKGILILVLIMLFASFLRLTMISWLLRNALSVGVFAVVVIFQPELRRLLASKEGDPRCFFAQYASGYRPECGGEHDRCNSFRVRGYVQDQDRRAHRVRAQGASRRDHRHRHESGRSTVCRAHQEHFLQEQPAA